MPTGRDVATRERGSGIVYLRSHCSRTVAARAGFVMIEKRNCISVVGQCGVLTGLDGRAFVPYSGRNCMAAYLGSFDLLVFLGPLAAGRGTSLRRRDLDRHPADDWWSWNTGNRLRDS